MKERCNNHPDRNALSFCHSCNQYYCSECLNEGKEYYYCQRTQCQQLWRKEKEEEKEKREESINRTLSKSQTFKALIKCETCGSSEEVEGDFVAYQASSVSHTTFDGHYQTTTTNTKYFNIAHFPFRGCIECTRSKLLSDLKSSKIFGRIILYTSLIGLSFGIYGMNTFPKLSNWLEASAIAFTIGLLSLFIWFFGYGEIKETEQLLEGFPSDRVKVSSALLKIFKKRIEKEAHSKNPSEYKNNKNDSPKNYFIVSKHEWETKISPNKF